MKVTVERVEGKAPTYAPKGFGPTPDEDRRHAVLGLGDLRGTRVIVRGRSSGRVCHGMLAARGAELFCVLDAGVSGWFPVTDVEPE